MIVNDLVSLRNKIRNQGYDWGTIQYLTDIRIVIKYMRETKLKSTLRRNLKKFKELIQADIPSKPVKVSKGKFYQDLGKLQFDVAIYVYNQQFDYEEDKLKAILRHIDHTILHLRIAFYLATGQEVQASKVMQKLIVNSKRLMYHAVYNYLDEVYKKYTDTEVKYLSARGHNRLRTKERKRSLRKSQS